MLWAKDPYLRQKIVQNQTYIDRNKFEEFKFTFDSCLNEVILYELRVFRFITRENILHQSTKSDFSFGH